MTRTLAGMAVAIALVLLGAAPATGMRPAFTGTWVGVDIDGSNLTLSIGGGPNPQVNLYDDGATVCSEGTVPPDVAARARGTGIVTGDTLTSELDVVCLTTPPTDAGVFGYALTANPDGTLTDGLGVVYHRR